MASVVGSSSAWFFGENASMDGWITRSRASSRPSHRYARRERMYRDGGATSSDRNRHARRTVSLSSSAPTWQCHTTIAPASRAVARARDAVDVSTSVGSTKGPLIHSIDARTSIFMIGAASTVAGLIG